MEVKKKDFKVDEVRGKFVIRKIDNPKFTDYMLYDTEEEAKKRIENIVNNTNTFWGINYV